MIDLKELRIDNIVFNDKLNKQIEICGIIKDKHILTIGNTIDEFDEFGGDDISPIILDQETINKLENNSIIQFHKTNKQGDHIYYFNGQTATYFLVYDNKSPSFFIGMIDVNLPEGYRRLTKPFYSLHRLQNAFYTIYDKELKSFF